MAKRTYANKAIAVHWDSTRCIHTGICLRGLPSVFNLEASPWLALDGADADEVASIVERCPSGALRYERLDGAEDEVADSPTTIVPRPNGPLMVRGSVRVETARGELFGDECRMTLCRCGNSKNQPFCDLSHRGTGFRDNPRVISDDRSAATDPSQVAAEGG